MFISSIRNNQLAERFSEQFHGSSLLAAMAEFSLPTTLSDKCHPINSPHQQVTKTLVCPFVTLL